MGSQLSKESIDPEVLAALLSGTLPMSERNRVLALLASDDDARFVLQMAVEALKVAESANLPLARRRAA